MLYDNVYMLSEIFHHFLLDHPGLQEDSVAEKADFTQQFGLLSRLPEGSEQFAWLNRTHREL